MNIFGTTGQERRNWLDERAAAAENALRYYLGPTGIPDRLNALATALQYTDAGDYAAAAESSRNLWNNLSVAAAGDYLTSAAALAMPYLGARMMTEGVENATDWAIRARDSDTLGAFRAWHGSPHDFDRFDMSKIGTGEGAQAYGHGLYFADSEDVARAYQQMGRPKSLYTTRDEGGWRAVYTDARGQQMQTDVFESADEAMDNARGRLYEVSIDADPEDFLDWDAPLSAQPERVQGLLSRLPAIPENHWTRKSDTGGAIYRGTADVEMDFSGVATSQRLREAGIPGIRYLDQGSRGAGDGTRNYVVFDDSLISILNKYGLAGILGLGAASTQQERPEG